MCMCCQAELVKAAFDAQRKFLNCVSKCKRPSQQVLETLLKPMSEQISAVQVLMMVVLTVSISNDKNRT